MSNKERSNKDVGSIEEAIKRCKELIKHKNSEWIGLSNQNAIKIILGNLEALCDMQRTADRELENARRINEEHKKINGELREKVKELEEYIFVAPNLDEMTATKYAAIQREAYIKGRAEEQQKAEQIIYENYIPKQKIKDKIEELEKLIEKIKEDDEYTHEIPLYEHDIKLLQELLQESEEK